MGSVPARYIDQIGFLFAPADEQAVARFLDSDEVSRGRFGTMTQNFGPRGKQVTTLQQEDGLRISCHGTDQIQIAYTLPQDVRDAPDLSLEQFHQRTRRLLDLFAGSYAPTVHWGGFLVQVFQPVPDASSAIDAVNRWLHTGGAPGSVEQLATFSFHHGVRGGDVYSGVVIQGYEVRSMPREQAEQAQKDGRVLHSVDFILDEAGIEFRVDINNKTRKAPSTIGSLVQELSLHFQSQQTKILARAMEALGMSNA